MEVCMATKQYASAKRIPLPPNVAHSLMLQKWLPFLHSYRICLYSESLVRQKGHQSLKQQSSQFLICPGIVFAAPENAVSNEHILMAHTVFVTCKMLTCCLLATVTRDTDRTVIPCMCFDFSAPIYCLQHFTNSAMYQSPDDVTAYSSHGIRRLSSPNSD